MASNTSGSSASGLPPAASGLLGVNQLQSVIDKFTGAVNKLDSIMQGWGSKPTGFGSGGNGSSSQQQQQYGGFPSMSNPFSGSGTIKPVYSYDNATGTMQPNGSYRFSYAGQAQPGQSFPNGGGSAPPSPGGRGGNGGFGLPSTMGASLSGMWGAIQGFGARQLPVQSAMSAYVQMGTLAAPNGMSNGTASAMLRAAAYGSGPGNINAIANNPYDATQGQALINWASGSFAGRNSLGGAMTGAANMFGYANQGLGYAGSAQLAQTMYSPQMSMAMMQAGYGFTPRALGGGRAMSSPAVMGSMMQSWYQGRRSVSQKVLNAGLAPGGMVNANLSALGISGQNLTNMDATLQAYNKLANAGFTNGQINSLFTGARNDNQIAIDKLSAAGIRQSDLQVLKNRTASQTATSANEMGGFNAGLRQSVGLLTEFNKMLSFITGGPIGTAIGWMGGTGAGGSIAHTSGVTGFLSSALGLVTGGATAALGKFGGAAPAASGKTSQSSPARKSASGGGASGAARAAVGWAEQEIGKPYVWGASSPQTGFDCSGLTQWSYAQAGVKIPRTSQEQWAALQNRSVGLNQVQQGDLVFSAGSGDGGTFASPGHVAMMISGSQIIEAPTTGQDVQIRAYSPSEWQHAARPTGPGAMGTGPSGGTSSPGSSAGGFTGSFAGSTSEAANVMGALAMGAGFGGSNGGSTTSTNGTSLGSSGTSPAAGNVTGTAALAKKMAAARGWTGALWNDVAFVASREDATWSLTAKNPTSPAYGIAQFINGPSEYYQYGGNPNTAAGQITGFFNYMQQRYHGPAGAAAHEQAFNSYGQGTMNARRGPAIVGERGVPEVVWMNGGEKVTPLGQMGAARGGRSPVILQFQLSSGAIQLHGIGSGSDVSNSAREIAHSIGKYLEQEKVTQQIAAGVAGG